MADLTSLLSVFLSDLYTGTVNIGGASDALFVREAADTIAQRRGTNLQVHRLYRTFTDASNYERLNILASSSSLRIYTESAGTGSNRALELGAAGSVQWQITTAGHLVGQSNTGFGYSPGSGGTVTQITSKATGVTLSFVTGEITMHNASLNAATAVSFTLTNTTIAAGDYVLVQHVSGGTVGAYSCVAVAGAGSATITVRNDTAGALGEAIVLKYVVIKAATT